MAEKRKRQSKEVLRLTCRVESSDRCARVTLLSRYSRSGDELPVRLERFRSAKSAKLTRRRFL